MPEPMERSSESSIQQFMNAGRIEKPVIPLQSSTLSTRNNIIPEPISGTVYGSARNKWDEQRRLGNIPSTAIAQADVVNLDGTGKEDDKNTIDLMRLLQAGGRGVTNVTGEFGDSLKDLGESNSPENLERARGLYTEMLNESLKEIFDLVEKDVIRDEKNAYPYDYRQAEFLIANIAQTIGSLERTPWMEKSKEGQVFVSEIRQDVLWLESFLQTTVAQTASLPYKFDVVLQLQLLKESRYRAFVTNDDMEGMMSTNAPGLELTKEQVRIKNDQHVGLNLPDEYKKYGFGEGPTANEPMSLRELATRMHAASFKLRMNLAAVSQVDFEKADSEKTTFKGNHLTKEEVFFYKDLFWYHDKDEKEGHIMTPHITAKGEHVRKSTALLEAALETNAYFRLKAIVSSGGTYDEKIVKISEITKEVKALALNKEANWANRQDKNIVTMLSTLTTQQGLMQDYSYGHSSVYCWEYLWETDKDGNPTKKKKVEMGGIATPSGDWPSIGFARRKHEYDGMGNSCTKFLLPTAAAGRKEASMYPPYEMPPFKIEESDDAFLIEQWNFLFSDDPKYVQERNEMGYKSLHPEITRQLKEWAFKWVTPYTDYYLEDFEERKKITTKKNLVVPHLLPASLGNIANFYDSLTLDTKKLNFGGKSVWQDLVEGKETYDINWGKLDTQVHTRWMIDLDMASRYMKVLIEPVDESKDPMLGLFQDPGTFGPKELAKRLRLSMRDSNDGPPTAFELAIIPFVVVMACAEKYGISGAYGWSKTTKEDKESNTSNADRFFVEMAYWKRALGWLPSDRPSKDKFNKTGEPELDYGNTMSLLAEFYEAVISRVMKSSSEESFYVAKTNLEKTANRINKSGYLNKGAFSYKINKDKALQK